MHGDLPDAQLTSVPAGSTAVKLLLPPESSVAGVVLDEAGQPVPEFTLQVLPGPTPAETPAQKSRRIGQTFRTGGQPVRDPGGAFVLRRLAPGVHELVVTATDGRQGSQVVTLDPGGRRTGVRILVVSGIRAVGRVVNHRTGAAIANLRLQLRGGITRDLAGTTGADGRFAIEGVPVGGTVRVAPVLEPNSYLPDALDVRVPSGAASIDLGTLRLLKGDAREVMSPERGVVGMTIMADGDSIRVREVQPGSPAEQAGLRPGDQIFAIDGVPVAGLGPASVGYLVSGKVGTAARVEVVSGGSPSRQAELVRQPRPEVPGQAR